MACIQLLSMQGHTRTMIYINEANKNSGQTLDKTSILSLILCVQDRLRLIHLLELAEKR